MARGRPHGMEKRCAHCGQTIHQRLGVYMSAFHVALFDVLAKATDGIGPEGLAARFYHGLELAIAKRRIYTHIHQLNEWLAPTDCRVVNIGESHDALYTLENYKPTKLDRSPKGMLIEVDP